MANNNVKMNTLRNRATKSDDITEEMWNKVNESSRYFYDEYFKLNSNLSPDTLIQYKSALRIFFYYIYENCKNKNIWKIKKTDFIKYVNFLENNGLSSSAIKVKRYAVSSFCNTMEIISEEIEEDDDYPDMCTFRHFARVKIEVAKNQTYEKIPITRAEYEKVMEKLKEDNDILAIAYWGIAFNIGARRSEMLQLKSDLSIREKQDGKSFYLSDNIRLKGKGKTGKVEKYMINDEAMEYIKFAVDNKGYDSEYIFQNKNGKPLSRAWVNKMFKDKISPILGRRSTSHNMKNSCATYLLENGFDIKLVSKYVCHHESVDVTMKFYDLRNNDEEINEMFK